MNACITRETFVFTVFRRVFHSTLKLQLCRHACRRRDPIISTCRYGKNMPTTPLIRSVHVNYFDRSFPHSCLVALIMRGLEAHPLVHVGVYLIYPYLSVSPGTHTGDGSSVTDKSNANLTITHASHAVKFLSVTLNLTQISP